MHSDHSGAGAGGHDDVVKALESGNDIAGNCRRILTVAGIIGGLAAAGLGKRRINAAARLLEELHRGKADAWPNEVDQAGDEQPDAVLRGLHDAIPGEVEGVLCAGECSRKGDLARRRWPEQDGYASGDNHIFVFRYAMMSARSS